MDQGDLFGGCPWCGAPHAPGDPCAEPREAQGPGATARGSDPDTSHGAARAWTRAQLTQVQQRVWAVHRAQRAGLTDEQLLHEYRRHYGATAESSPRKRRCDLTQAGLLADSGQRRPLVSGRLGIVWVVVGVVDETPADETPVEVH